MRDDKGPNVRGGPLAAARGGLCVLATLGMIGECAAQSPFADTPARSGSLTIPSSPSPSTPFAQPPAPGRPTMPLRPGVIPPPGMAFPSVETRQPGDLPLPLPLPPTGPGRAKEEMPEPGELPPRPTTAPELSVAETGPVPKSDPVVLKAGMTVTLRVSQVLPKDGLSSGERLLNGRPAIQPGDGFLAEMVEPSPPYPVLVGGVVQEIIGPGRFGRPGHLRLRMTQLVSDSEHQAGVVPWRMDTADRRFSTRMRRIMLATLLGLEGAGTGASVGAQFSGGNMAFIGGGMGIGALVGLGYATFQRGTEPNLEPGDTFRITVGTTEFRPVSREWRTILYPADDPGYDKAKRR